MRPDGRREKSMADYRQSLILALRLKDVPGERIGEVVAEVESHVADTGQSPAEAFGSPRAYAALVTAGRLRDPWWRIALTALPAGIAGWLVARGVLALLMKETYLGESGWLWLAVGVVVALLAGVDVHRRSTRVRDPRTGDDMVPMSRWAHAALIGLLLVVIVVGWGAIELVDALT